MKISESLAPEARRLPCVNINIKIKDISKDALPSQKERGGRATFGKPRASPIAAWKGSELQPRSHKRTLPFRMPCRARSDQLRHSTWKGLKSKALTAPVCFCLWAIKGSFPEERMWVTLYKVSMPLSPPPAITPEFSRSPLPKLPQINL